MSEFERKPDGGLNDWIETYEAMGGGENDAEILCLLLELRRRRENQAEAEREHDELRKVLQETQVGLIDAINHALQLQAEISRRDAAAGEPVAWQYRYNDGKVGDWKTVDSESECNHSPCYERRRIYTAAPPAVLPPEKPVVFGSDLCQDIENYGYNLALADTRQLGAQQQKVVELPMPVKWPEIPFKYFSEEQVFSMLDAAGVKWEVRK